MTPWRDLFAAHTALPCCRRALCLTGEWLRRRLLIAEVTG